MGLMKKLTSAVVASSLVLGLVGTAAADYSPAAVESAAARMKALGVVQGRLNADGTTDLQLGANITRAELVTIIVRAFGQGETAKLLKGAPAFSDSASHWASGEIFVAKNIIESKGHTLGVTPTTFEPNKNVTAAEAIAFVMKFLGVKADTTQSWPMDFISGAVKAGLITEADKTALTVAPNSAAVRGLVFYLADHAFSSYKLENGKTVYTTYVDDKAPVVTVDSYEANTTAAKVTLTGTASGQAVLHVGSTSNVVTVGADGKWSADVELALGQNDVWVHALDLAGNAGVPATAVKITRVAGAAASIEADVPATVAAGGSFELAAKAFDANKAEVAGAEFTVTVEGNIGTYADGKFTAATTAGTGKLTIKSGDATKTVDLAVVAGPLAKVVADKAGAAPGEIVTLSAQDEYGNAISGATFTQTSTDAMLDSATGKFMASKAGTYTVTAKVGGVEKTATVGVFGGFDSKAKVVVEAPATIVGNNASEASVVLKVVDANGNVITSFDGTVALNDGNLDSTVDVALKNGQATYTLTAPNAATGQIVTLTGSATKGAVTVTGTAKVQVIQQVATSVKVDSPTYLTVNNTDGTLKTSGTNVKVFVLDQDGKAMKTGAYAAKLSLTGPATFTQGSSVTSVTVNYTPNADTANGHDDNGAVVAIYPTGLSNVGTVSFTGELAGLTSGTDTTTAAYAQSQSQVTASLITTDEKYVADFDTAAATAATFRASLKDANGVPVAKPGVNVTFDLDVDYTAARVWQVNSDGTRTLLTADPVVATGANGTADLTIESETFVGTLTATPKVTDLTSSSASVTFTTGDAYYVKFVRSTMEVPQGTESVDLSAQIYDKAGNKVKKEGVLIVFTANNTDTFVNGGAKAEVKTDANGIATVKVTTIGYVRTATYDVTLDGVASDVHFTSADRTNPLAPVFGNSNLTASIRIDNTVAANVTVQTKVGADPKFYVTTAENVTVLATVTDARGNKLTGETVKLVLPKGTIVSGGALNTAEVTYDMTEVDAVNQPGVYSYTVVFGKAPTANFTVKVTTGLSDVVANGTIAVEAGTAAGVKVATDSNDKVLPTKGSVSGPYTISLVDAYGNNVFANSTTNKVKIAWTLDTAVNAAAGEYFEIKASNSGAALTGTTAGSTLEIPVGSSSVSFYVFTNVDRTVTFTGFNTDATTGAATTQLTNTDGATVDAQ